MTAATSPQRDPDHPDQWPPGLFVRFKSLSLKKVRRAGTHAEVLAVCLRHNLRQNNGNHRHRSPIAPARTPLNTVLAGAADPEIAAELAASILAELDITLPARVDAVAGFEVALQPPDGFDSPAFWSEALAWVGSRFQHVISFVIHRDQVRPHAHLLVLPILDGKYAGSALQAGENRFRSQRASFMSHMLEKLGLRPHPKKTKPRTPKTLAQLAVTSGKGAKTHAAAARRDAELVRAAGDDWKHADVCMDVGVHGCSEPDTATSMHPTSTIAQSPPHADSLEKVRSLWVQCFPTAGKPVQPMAPCPKPPPTSPCPKPPAASTTSPPTPTSASSPRPAAPPAPAPPPDADASPGFSRERDADHQAGQWCAETGEFVNTPTRPRTARAEAQAWVAQQLARTGHKRTKAMGQGPAPP